jgi:aldehyde:ferredoxin oxidoreductase
MKLLRVDMNQLAVEDQPVPKEYEQLGGRALIAKLLLEEIPPDCDALGPYNKLIFAPGLLGGAGVTTAGRLSIGAKSPLTGGVKEANTGGTAGDTFGRMGIKGVVVEGQTSNDEFYILHISKDTTKLLPAGKVRELGTYATVDHLQKKHKEDCTVISIGQAGEFLLSGASIACTGEGNQLSNQAARGGLGAVMGSKGLKAIVIDMSKDSVPLADSDLFRKASKRFAQEILDSPKLGPKGGTHTYGTSAITAAVNEMGSLPTRNFSAGSFEKIANLQGEHLREVVLARGGEIGKRCMPGCVIACRNVYVDEDKQPIVGTVQFETIALVGSNLGLDNLDDVARINYMCNDFGLDTIETGAALGVAIEAGLASFGDFDSIVALLKQVGEGTVLGRVLGNGATTTGNPPGTCCLGASNAGVRSAQPKGEWRHVRYLTTRSRPYRRKCLRCA